VYIVNNNRNSNVCNYMKRKYDIPLILEFAEKGLISFQYKSYLDIDKMNSFVTYISVRTKIFYSITIWYIKLIFIYTIYTILLLIYISIYILLNFLNYY